MPRAAATHASTSFEAASGRKVVALLLAAEWLPSLCADLHSATVPATEAGLIADDECGSVGTSDGAECALSALQRRSMLADTSKLAESAGGSVDPTHGVKHYKWNCWRQCQGAGWCPHFCGEGNACCRSGWTRDPPECKGVTYWPRWYTHTCVVSPMGRSPPGGSLPREGSPPQAPAIATIYRDPRLFKPSSAEVQEFYMYRVQTDEDYDPENQNLGNVGGVLWYLHNEIVWHPGLQRSGTAFSTAKTRVERFHVKTKATQPLWEMGFNFGVVNEFDSTKCTGPYDCNNFARYGFTVGCETWVKGSNSDFPHTQWVGDNLYPNATWYSFPGACTSQGLSSKTDECRKREPGGHCTDSSEPTGTGDCTYTYEKVGELSIDELEGLNRTDDFIEMGGAEYNKKFDEGILMHFWDGKGNVTQNQLRIDFMLELFRSKYPEQADLPDPHCDFNKRVMFPGTRFPRFG